MVYVLNIDSKPLMPCSNTKARHLLEQGKAIRVKSISKEIFTIRLTSAVSGYKEEIRLGIDAGSKHIGISASSERREYFSAELELRDDITKLLTARREARRSRRNRLRYRAPRFDNRVRSKNRGWLAPSVENKIATHLRAVDLVCSILPISEIIVEVAAFDTQLLQNPGIEGKMYQNGETAGFLNAKEYVRFRDGCKCQLCKGKTGDRKLEVHHIVQRKDGGSNRPSNLITLCHTCHSELHADPEAYPLKAPKGYRHETFMGIMRWTFYNRLKELYGDKVSMTYGYITRELRNENSLEKSHRTDALCITGYPKAERLDHWLYSKKNRCHNRQIHKANKLKGGKLKLNQAPRLVKGFRLFDKVEYQSHACFITGRRSSGYFALKTLNGTSITDSVSYKNIRFLEETKSMLVEKRVPTTALKGEIIRTQEFL